MHDTKTFTAISLTEASYSVTVTVARTQPLRMVPTWPCIVCTRLTRVSLREHIMLQERKLVGVRCLTCKSLPPTTEAQMLVKGAA